jgi:transposase
MKPYSSEFRHKIVKIYEQDDKSIRKVAATFDVSKGWVQKIKKNDWSCSTQKTFWEAGKVCYTRPQLK